jgi:hypothetical protein
MNGNPYRLAQWFQIPEDRSGPADDFVREEILSEVYRFTEYAISDRAVIFRTPHGRAIAEARDNGGCPIVDFDYVPDDRVIRLRFWMNASSVADLGERLRAQPEKRRTFDELFFN